LILKNIEKSMYFLVRFWSWSD